MANEIAGFGPLFSRNFKKESIPVRNGAKEKREVK